MNKRPYDLLYWLCWATLFGACSQSNSKSLQTASLIEEPSRTDIVDNAYRPSPAFKKYWYNGKAEISSYDLEQARYGELRSGTAVLIYVTEDFLPQIQVKADQSNPKNIPILKLNSTKNFNTGIYPYTIMQSSFYPIADHAHALKVSGAVQEWCGHVYTQLNNRDKFEITAHSYFQGEADQQFALDKVVLENELWNKIRIRPKKLPMGNLKVIPSLEFCSLKHIEIKAYKASASLEEGPVSSRYQLRFPELNRTLEITFNTQFPYTILGWEESWSSGSETKAKTLVTKATLKKSILSDYWNQNKNKNKVLRDRLGL